MGLNPENFSWLLAPGERFDTPEALMVYSDAGIGGMSRTFHKLISRNIIRGALEGQGPADPRQQLGSDLLSL